MYICIFSFHSYQAYMPNTYRGFLKYIYVIHRLGGPYQLGEIVRPRAVLRPRAQFLPIWTDLGR